MGMYVMVKSGWGGVLDGDSRAVGFETYDEAFEAMKAWIQQDAVEQGIFYDKDDYGWERESGHGFAGAQDGPEYQIFSI